MIEIARGWTNVIYHSNSRYFSAAHPQKSKAVFDQKCWKPQIVPYVQHKWHADTIREPDLVKAE